MPRDLLEDVAQAIYAHPNFDQAAMHYTENILRWRHEMGRFNKVLSSYVRNHIVSYVIFLHFANRTGDPENGASYTKLLNLVTARKQCGSRFLRTVLTLLSWTGYVTSFNAPSDRRVKVYVPTQRLIKQTQDYYTYVMECFDFLVPDKNFGAKPRGDAQFMPHVFFSAGSAYLDNNIELIEIYPELLELMQRDGGCPTLLAWVQADLLQQPAPSSKAIATRFNISLSQVRKVTKESARFGMIRQTDDGRIVDVSAIAEVYRRFIAREFGLYAKYSLALEDHFTRSPVLA